MDERFQAWVRDMRTEQGASDEALRALGDAARVGLPDDYLAFLRRSDGAEGHIGFNYVAIWPSGEITADPYPFEESVPGLLFFAGDGGEALFGFDTRERPMPVVVTHRDDLDPDTLVLISTSFDGFLAFLRERSWIDYWSEYRRQQRG